MTRPNSLRFPWEAWLFADHPISAKAGRDFHQSVKGFKTMLRREAKRVGLTVHAKEVGKSEVWFRFGRVQK